MNILINLIPLCFFSHPPFCHSLLVLSFLPSLLYCSSSVLCLHSLFLPLSFFLSLHNLSTFSPCVITLSLCKCMSVYECEVARQHVCQCTAPQRDKALLLPGGKPPPCRNSAPTHGPERDTEREGDGRKKSRHQDRSRY